jgi:hypothetical protein
MLQLSASLLRVSGGRHEDSRAFSPLPRGFRPLFPPVHPGANARVPHPGLSAPCPGWHSSGQWHFSAWGYWIRGSGPAPCNVRHRSTDRGLEPMRFPLPPFYLMEDAETHRKDALYGSFGILGSHDNGGAPCRHPDQPQRRWALAARGLSSLRTAAITGPNSLLAPLAIGTGSNFSCPAADEKSLGIDDATANRTGTRGGKRLSWGRTAARVIECQLCHLSRLSEVPILQGQEPSK